MLTFLFELYFTVLPHLAYFFEVVSGSFFSIFYLPSYLSVLFPEPQNYVLMESIFWLYYAVLLSSAIVFIIYSIRQLPELIRSTQKHFKVIQPRQWFLIWIIVFIFLFPGLLAVQSIDYFFQGESGIGFAVILTLFFFITAGHAAVLIFILFGIKMYILSLAKRYAQIAKLIRLIPTKVSTIVHVLLLLYPFAIGLSTVGWFLTDGINNPQSSRFFVINAAIKNTCFIDQNRANCPHSKEEIGYIEPEEYKRATDCCQVRYQYNPEINQYSLVIRYAPTKAVLFDWRLVTTQHQIDFKEYDVAVIGQDHLINPPDWDGPWKFDDWEYL
mgnify:CR=1 FL=1